MLNILVCVKQIPDVDLVKMDPETGNLVRAGVPTLTNPLDLNADTYYKIIDGVCWSWNRTDACMDGQVCTYFYVDTPPRQEPPRNNNSGSGLEGLAKGLFKKIVR